MNRRLRALLGAVATTAALAAGTLLAPPAQAASSVAISKIYYDSQGKDTGSNASLNGEYIVLKNLTSTAKTITGWTVRDPAGHVYTFPKTTIKANGTVTVRSGKGTDSGSTRYWQKSWYVWNNTGDTATVRNSNGTKADACTCKDSPSSAVSTTC
jgi:hypothetical protein